MSQQQIDIYTYHLAERCLLDLPGVTCTGGSDAGGMLMVALGISVVCLLAGAAARRRYGRA